MKTAAQILEERFEPNGFSLKKALGLKDDSNLIADPAYKRILFAMQIYAFQALDEAAKKARCRTNDDSTSIIVDKESILEFKAQLR